MTPSTVGLARRAGASYPTEPPFDPAQAYPELAGLPGGRPPVTPARNDAYDLVRTALLRLGLDAAGVGTPLWNPFRTLVPRVGLVVIKPNLVLESAAQDHPNLGITTHGSVIRPLIDYVRLAGGADVEILIGDVPLQGADFDTVVEQNGLRAMIDILRRRGDDHLSLHDLRRERAIVDATGFVRTITPLAGDPRGYVEVDIGPRSALEGLKANDFEGFAVADYQASRTQRAHAEGSHRYLVPASVLEAACFINVPKLKTHQKAGLTVAIKNLVGVNGDKARIPHFRLGGPDTGGDEYPPGGAWLRALQTRTTRLLQQRSRVVYHAARRLWRMSRRWLIPRQSVEGAAGASTLVSGGAWYGNDTLWRALHDLNLLLRFADKAGRLSRDQQRRYLCVTDGIVAGEGDGPLKPSPRTEGVILAAEDPLAMDLVAAAYMGLDWRRVPTLARALDTAPPWTTVRAPLEAGGIHINAGDDEARADRPFRPPPGWLGRLERPDAP